MKLLLIYTGGTIGMVPSDRGWRPQPGYLESRIRAHVRQEGVALDFDWLEYAPLIDSSQIDTEHWNTLAEDLIAHYDDYDGFVVLHGTDTMAYTTAALSFMLRGTRKPVVVTGSQVPVWEAHTDGLDNVILALHHAQRKDLHEVYLAFNHSLFHGAHVTKIDTDGFKTFDAPHGIHLAEVKPGEPAQPRFIPSSSEPIEIYHCLPGIPLTGLRALLKTKPRALIMLTYGSGNAPDTPELRDLLTMATQQGTLLINRSQCYRANVDMDRYEAAAALRETGMIGSGTMTLEALVAKLRVLFTVFDSDIDVAQHLLTPWTQELPLPKAH